MIKFATHQSWFLVATAQHSCKFCSGLHFFPDSEENLDFLVFYPKCEVLTKAGYWQSTSAYKITFLVEKVIKTQLTLIYPNSIMFKNNDAHFYPPPRSLGNQLQ